MAHLERQDEMMKQFEPMMRATVTDQVRVQSQELVQSVQAHTQCHAQEVDTRIEAHDASIKTMQEAQQKTTSEVKGIGKDGQTFEGAGFWRRTPNNLPPKEKMDMGIYNPAVSNHTLLRISAGSCSGSCTANCGAGAGGGRINYARRT
jgi:hypothetical protein